MVAMSSSTLTHFNLNLLSPTPMYHSTAQQFTKSVIQSQSPFQIYTWWINDPWPNVGIHALVPEWSKVIQKYFRLRQLIIHSRSLFLPLFFNFKWIPPLVRSRYPFCFIPFPFYLFCPFSPSISPVLESRAQVSPYACFDQKQIEGLL